MRMIAKTIKKLGRKALERTDFGVRYFYKRAIGVGDPLGQPNAPWPCAVLKDQKEVDASVAQVKSLGLPPTEDLPKNWDSLAAVDCILRKTDKNANIFDAGGAYYSMIAPWLYLYGYKRLTVGNLDFSKPEYRGKILYEHADITQTKYTDGCFDAITCISVIEHGVELNAYFKEMSRILKVGGVLITSTDYFDSPIDTQGKEAFGAPIHIFSKEDINKAFEIAAHHGLSLIEPIDLTAGEKVVHWNRVDLHYTFMIFTLEKIR